MSQSVTDSDVEKSFKSGLILVARWKRRIERWMDPAAFEEAVMSAVLRARDTYNPDHPSGASFATWASHSIRGAILEEDRKQRRKPPPFSIEEFFGGPDRGQPMSRSDWSDTRDARPGGLTFEEAVPSAASGPAQQVGARVYAEHIVAVIDEMVSRDMLTPVAREVVILRFLGGRKQRDVARVCGLTPCRIHQIEQDALRKIRVQLGVTELRTQFEPQVEFNPIRLIRFVRQPNLDESG